jgi:hypothetical protein
MTMALLAGNAVEAEAIIKGWVKECAEGRSDREIEALGLAAKFGHDVKETELAFVEAREVAKAAAQQRKVEIIPPPKPRLIRRPIRLVDATVAKAEAKPSSLERCEGLGPWAEGLGVKTLVWRRGVEWSPVEPSFIFGFYNGPWVNLVSIPSIVSTPSTL